jgi:flagellin-specific chaperone FliS
MIGQNPIRTKKSYSMVITKEDKENCSNNIQLQGLNGQNKLVKLRESLEQCNQPEKIISSLKIDIKDENEDLGTNLKKTYSWLARRDYSADILKTLILKTSDVGEALKNHMITPQLRAKMVDWMI